MTDRWTDRKTDGLTECKPIVPPGFTGGGLNIASEHSVDSPVDTWTLYTQCDAQVYWFTHLWIPEHSIHSVMPRFIDSLTCGYLNTLYTVWCPGLLIHSPVDTWTLYTQCDAQVYWCPAGVSWATVAAPIIPWDGQQLTHASKERNIWKNLLWLSIQKEHFDYVMYGNGCLN